VARPVGGGGMGMKLRNAFNPNTKNMSPSKVRAMMMAIFMVYFLGRGIFPAIVIDLLKLSVETSITSPAKSDDWMGVHILISPGCETQNYRCQQGYSSSKAFPHQSLQVISQNARPPTIGWCEPVNWYSYPAD
jgi:hypothetical protein